MDHQNLDRMAKNAQKVFWIMLDLLPTPNVFNLCVYVYLTQKVLTYVTVLLKRNKTKLVAAKIFMLKETERAKNFM